MRHSTLVLCALLMVATSGCEQWETAKGKVKLAWDKVRGREATPPAPPPVATPQLTDTATIADEPGRPRPPATPQGTSTPLRDTPFVSEDTGTIAPGMSEREVYETWGSPAAVRRMGEFTYLFFQNGCEYTCGTMDVVTLQNGMVIDAIVRWDGHRYAGQSSSPPGRTPSANPGGETLELPPSPPPDTTTGTP
jgi:hypothetical protein